MNCYRYFSILFCFLGVFSTPITSAQSTAELTFPIQASASQNPPSTFLVWPNPGVSDVRILRREQGQSGSSWITLLDQTGSFQSSYIDQGVALGKTYEYAIRRINNGVTAWGYVSVAVFTPVVDQRGKLLVFIDSATADGLGTDLRLFKDDIRGEGWQVVPFKTGPFTTVQWIKNQVVAAYNTDPANVKAILLIGDVPVPYAGNTAWDETPDHSGAWPSDAYYGDINGTWTDNTVDNTTPPRVANRNVPGDGKFDQSTLPSEVELLVGRLDFSRLTTGTFGLSPLELLRRYVYKIHAFRTGQAPALAQSLVDHNLNAALYPTDNYRTAYALGGATAINSGDWMSNSTPYLLGFGSGTGTYSSIAGVCSSAQLAADSLHLVYAQVQGTYAGDWDFETDPLLPALLASRGHTLAATWTGRPVTFSHHLAAGATVSYCIQATQNAQFNTAYVESFGESGTHISLLGDPTLRLQNVPAVPSLTVNSNCDRVNLQWTAAPTNEVQGYYIYRSFALDGPYQRITPNLINALSWADMNPVADTLFYQVRAVKFESAPGGGVYYNASTGIIRSTIFVPGTPPTVIGLGGVLTCSKTSLTLGANFQPFNANFVWFSPSGQQLPGFTATEGGIYTVLVTAPNGCTASASATVVMDTVVAANNLNVPTQFALTCTNTTLSWVIPPQAPNTEYRFNGVLVTPGQLVSIQQQNIFEVKNLGNDCIKTYSIPLVVDTDAPTVGINASSTTLTCSITNVILEAVSTTPNVIFSWGSSTLSVNTPGQYCVVATNVTNGCTASACASVGQNVVPPLLTYAANVLNCQTPQVTLDANGTLPAGATYLWVGPNGFVSAEAEPSVTQGGLYSLIVTGANGCTNTSTVTVAQDQPFTVSINSNVPFCNPGQPIALTAMPSVPGTYSYLWSTGATTANLDLPATATGTYQVTVTQNGCSAVSAVTFGLPPTVLAFVDKESMPGAMDGAIDLFIASGTGTFTFSWSNGATTEDISGLSGGAYTVTVTNNSGCSTVLTILLQTTVSANEATTDSRLRVWPNPVSDHLYFHWPYPAVQGQLRWFDAQGRCVGAESLTLVQGQNHQLDVASLPAGWLLGTVEGRWFRFLKI
jgi:hypothetical protein